MSRGLGDTARAFATAFADRDQVEPYCWSVNELAELAGITPRAARMTVDVLRRHGVIVEFPWMTRKHADYTAVRSRHGDWTTYPTMPHARGRGPFYSLSTPEEIERARAARAECLRIIRAFGIAA